MLDMRRREFITLLGGAAVAWPLAARARESDRMRRVVVLMGFDESDPEALPRAAAFQQGLQDLGWTQGRNVRVDYRWGAGEADRMRTYATELISLAPDVIVADSTAVLVVVRQTTRAVPIVFLRVSDPVGSGFIDGLARPGGNLTGLTNFEYAMGGKWLELLKEMAPTVTQATVIMHPETTSHVGLWHALEAAAPSLGVKAIAAGVHDITEIERAIAAGPNRLSRGLIIFPHTLMEVNRKLIIEGAARYRLPAVYPTRVFAVSDGLMSYGLDTTILFRRVATYVDRILKGAKPAELPTQQPTKFELVINLKTAKVIGLEVSPMLLARADEVIE
jgi:putative tryptophan/tyrosine transport system substrate-binding protein